MPGEILLQNANRVNPETILVSDDDSAASLCWFFRRNDVYLLAKAGEYEYGLSCTDAEPRLVEIGRIYEFLEKRLPDTSIVLFAKQSFYDRHQTRWPRPAFEIRGCGFVMAEYAPTLATPTEPSVVLP